MLGAIALGGGKIDAFWLRLTAVVAFLLATAGGILLPRLGLGKNGTLALALIVEAAFVGVAPLFQFTQGSHNNVLMLVCLCFALGLQNGTFSKSEGVSVHATYITGDATSLLVSLLKRPRRRLLRQVPRQTHHENSPQCHLAQLRRGRLDRWFGGSPPSRACPLAAGNTSPAGDDLCVERRVCSVWRR